MKNSFLRYWFNRYNRKYFGGNLNRNILVQFSRLEEKYVGTCYGEIPIRIAISPELKGYKRYARTVLLHEMIHAKHIQADFSGQDHGRKFRQDLRRLMKLGAYDEIL